MGSGLEDSALLHRIARIARNKQDFHLREAARQLIGLVPVAGIVPKVAMAYAGTWAVGRAVAAWASEGRKLTPAAVRHFYREAWGRGKTVARAMAAQAGKARPKRSWFRRKRPKGE